MISFVDFLVREMLCEIEFCCCYVMCGLRIGIGWATVIFDEFDLL